jgi:hypothetical protein
LALKSIFRGAQAFVNVYRLFATRMQARSGGRG